MPDYLKLCAAEHKMIPPRSAIITSGDGFNFLTDVRDMNYGIDARRKPMRLHSIDDYDNYKKHVDATRPSASVTRLEDLTEPLDRLRTHISAFGENASFLYQCTFNKDKRDQSATISQILCKR